MALTAFRDTPEMGLIQINSLEYDVDGGSCLYAGGMSGLDASGRLVPMSALSTLIAVGRNCATVDNTNGANGAVKARVKPGVYRLTNGDAIVAADKGSECFFSDDETVNLSDSGGTRPSAGVIIDVDATGVWVSVGMRFLSVPAAAEAGTLQKRSVTVSFDDAAFLAESDDGDAVDVNVGAALPAGAVIVGSRYTIVTPFAGAGLATLTMIVGKSGDTNGLIEAVDVLGDAAGQYQGVIGTMMTSGPSLQSEVQIVANFDPDASAALDELTAGSLTIDVYYFVAF